MHFAKRARDAAAVGGQVRRGSDAGGGEGVAAGVVAVAERLRGNRAGFFAMSAVGFVCGDAGFVVVEAEPLVLCKTRLGVLTLRRRGHALRVTLERRPRSSSRGWQRRIGCGGRRCVTPRVYSSKVFSHG
jgi:hypothetical protein